MKLWLAAASDNFRQLLQRKFVSAEADIWCFSLDQAPVQALAQCLSPDEQARAQRFYFDRDRRRFIVGRGVLRMILGHYLSVAPERVRFRYGAYGKPCLAAEFAQSAVQFNLAHSHETGVCAVATRREVGIDVEYLRPVADFDQLAAGLFSAGELAVLCRLPPPQRLGGFFNGWTPKEAFIKANGAGLSYPLNPFEVTLDPAEPARLLSVSGAREQAAGWSLESFVPAPGYVAAVVTERRHAHLENLSAFNPGAVPPEFCRRLQE